MLSEAKVTETIFNDLSQRLLELRQHVDQIRTDLDRAGSEESCLRCHACGLRSVTGQAGWTLRLCGDDELHAFCPDCDRRHVDGAGRNRTMANARLPV